MENESKYKRRAYQYTLSSIMLNNVKNEYNEIKATTIANTPVEKKPITLKIEETVIQSELTQTKNGTKEENGENGENEGENEGETIGNEGTK